MVRAGGIKKTICFCLIFSFIAGSLACRFAASQHLPLAANPITADEKYVKLDSFDQKNLIEKFLRVKNEQALEIINEGVALLKQGKADAALLKFDDSIEVYPRNVEAYLWKIRVYLARQQYDEVIRILEGAGAVMTDYTLLYLYAFDHMKRERIPPAAPHSIISVAPFKDNKQAAVSFLFCDGSRTVYLKGLPIFEKFGFKATIPVIAGHVIERATSRSALEAGFGTWEEWRDAERRGFEISNHTIHHRDINNVSEEDLELEVNESFNLITEKIGKNPTSFVFPNDSNDPRGVNKVKERHMAVLDRDHLANVYQDVFMPYYGGEAFSAWIGERIIDFAIQENQWLIPLCHVIWTDELEIMHKPITEEFLQKHLAYLKEREDKVWVDTLTNIYAYLAEQKETKINVLNESDQGIVFTLENSLDPKVYTHPLTVIVDAAPLRPASASAVRLKSNESLFVKIVDTKLYLDVVPDSDSIKVQWK